MDKRKIVKIVAKKNGMSQKDVTMVFDEIDVGISGDIALKVAEKILNLSRTNQVFCITHLPQTASIAKSWIALIGIASDACLVNVVAWVFVRTLSKGEWIWQR